MKPTAAFLAFVVTATPVTAFEIEEIGMIEANFDGESISQPVVIVSDGANEDATAFFMSPGGGFTALSLAALNVDRMALGLMLDLNYQVALPAPEATPFSVEISYTRADEDGYWTSDQSPSAPVVTFSTLEFGDAEGRATGSFQAVLCYAEDYGSDADTGNCLPIEGRFDTRFNVQDSDKSQ